MGGCAGIMADHLISKKGWCASIHAAARQVALSDAVCSLLVLVSSVGRQAGEAGEWRAQRGGSRAAAPERWLPTPRPPARANPSQTHARPAAPPPSPARAPRAGACATCAS